MVAGASVTFLLSFAAVLFLRNRKLQRMERFIEHAQKHSIDRKRKLFSCYIFYELLLFKKQLRHVVRLHVAELKDLKQYRQASLQF